MIPTLCISEDPNYIHIGLTLKLYGYTIHIHHSIGAVYNSRPSIVTVNALSTTLPISGQTTLRGTFFFKFLSSVSRKVLDGGKA